MAATPSRKPRRWRQRWAGDRDACLGDHDRSEDGYLPAPTIIQLAIKISDRAQLKVVNVYDGGMGTEFKPGDRVTVVLHLSFADYSGMVTGTVGDNVFVRLIIFGRTTNTISFERGQLQLLKSGGEGGSQHSSN